MQSKWHGLCNVFHDQCPCRWSCGRTDLRYPHGSHWYAALSKKGPANVVTVVEWATIVRPVGRFPWVAYLLPVLALECIAAYGACSAISSPGGGGLWIAFWIALGVVPIVGSLGFLSRRLASVRDKAREEALHSSALASYLFSSSAIAPHILSWRDWKRGDEKGPGFLQLEESGLLIWTMNDGTLRSYAWSHIERVEVVRVWGRLIWSPQLRTHFSDGAQFMASLAHAGIKSVCGFSGAEMRSLVEQLERRVSGSSA